MARWLRERGVERGDIVVLTGTSEDADRISLPLAFLATAAVGAITALLPARAPVARQAQLLASLGAVRLAVTCELPLTGRPPEMPAGPDAVAAPAPDALASIDTSDEAPVALSIGAPVSLLFTSGSNGMPKAVAHTLANHMASAEASLTRLPLRPTDAWLVCLPLAHIGGLSILIRTLGSGARMELATAGRFTSAERPEVTELTRCTHVSLVDTQLARLLSLPERVLAHRPRLLIGGSAVRCHLMTEARRRGVPTHATYGSTEMCSQVATTDGDGDLSFAPDRLTVAARPIPGQQVRVAANGELLLRGPTLAVGYWRQGRLAPLTASDGWYRSGDAGQLLADGRLVVTGRTDSMFVSGGENVQPERVERVLLQHPAVHAACCVARADREFGARAVAFLEVDGVAIPPEDLPQLARSQLAPFEMPIAYLPMPAADGSKPNRVLLTRLANTKAAAAASRDQGR